MKKKTTNMTSESKGETLLSEIIIKIFPFTSKIFERFPWLAQFINFSIVGVINLFLSYLIYAVLIKLKFHPQIANQIAFWLSVLNGYFLNRFWVFKKSQSIKNVSSPIKYIITYGFNNVLGIFLIYLYVYVLNLSPYIAPLISMPITIPMNYCINKFWVFKKSKDII